MKTKNLMAAVLTAGILASGISPAFAADDTNNVPQKSDQSSIPNGVIWTEDMRKEEPIEEPIPERDIYKFIIPYQTIRIPNPNLDEGSENLIQEGINGYESTDSSGEFSRREPVDEIIEYGTRAVTTMRVRVIIVHAPDKEELVEFNAKNEKVRDQKLHTIASHNTPRGKEAYIEEVEGYFIIRFRNKPTRYTVAVDIKSKNFNKKLKLTGPNKRDAMKKLMKLIEYKAPKNAKVDIKEKADGTIEVRW